MGHPVWQPVSMKKGSFQIRKILMIVAMSIIIIYLGSMFTEVILNVFKN